MSALHSAEVFHRVMLRVNVEGDAMYSVIFDYYYQTPHNSAVSIPQSTQFIMSK